MFSQYQSTTECPGCGTSIELETDEALDAAGTGTTLVCPQCGTEWRLIIRRRGWDAMRPMEYVTIRKLNPNKCGRQLDRAPAARESCLRTHPDRNFGLRSGYVSHR